VAESKSTNITWHAGQVTRKDREKVLGQRGVTLWLTGLSGSGKSTVAVAAEHALVERGRLSYVLDGDNVRHGLNKNLGLYKKARAGQLPDFTGISAPYEAPERPELVLDTGKLAVPESVAALLRYLDGKGYLSA